MIDFLSVCMIHFKSSVFEKDTGLFLSQTSDKKLISISNRVPFYKKIALFTKLLSRRRSLGEFAAVITLVVLAHPLEGRQVLPS